ncbi:ArsR/SmtB family transcription factor [Sphaerisporangium siamense]|uniref:DNA-binding transcriptional ArsR family regulator n=1 Tax=Sphaerisporangium siamense TaxID=795645 RepID=A0A7W7DD73_9ACTN|nr:metalloregulator ArsR/SmtB family transcription factor [Sphaerisporangium siamense]MBB4704627.1 DNA-binding transcriptional ArsR family regulator [Sphaerisporangium siamense]
MMSSARELAHPEAADLVVTDVLFALSDPARLALVRRLAEGPLEVAACQPIEGEIPKSTLSHHLKTLREAGVIRNVPAGRRRYVSLRRDDLEGRFPGLLTAVLATPGPSDA